LSAPDTILALDIGGTKIHAGIINDEGKILASRRDPTEFGSGPHGFFTQVISIIKELSKGHKISRVGIGSAGPLNGKTGELLDPTNFFSDGKPWGRVSLLEPLRKALPSLQFYLDNDAAAAVLGEAWLGGGESRDLLVMTLGTGVGVGVLIGGELARTREGLHPEASHIPINAFDQSIPCGCGNFGCVEAYLSGTHFVTRLKKQWRKPELTGEQVLDLARAGEAPALAAIKLYSEWLAQAVHAYAVLYGPREVVFTGGFAPVIPLVLSQIETRLEELLRRRRVGIDLMPKLRLSRLGDDLGLVGAARVAMLGND
jgi:glucokinase